MLSFAGGALSFRRSSPPLKPPGMAKVLKKRRKSKQSAPKGAKPADTDSSKAAERTQKKRRKTSRDSVSSSVLKRRRRRKKKRARKAAGSEVVGKKAAVASPPRSVKMGVVSEETTPEILSAEGNLLPTNATLEAETMNLNRNNARTGLDPYMESYIQEMLRDNDDGEKYRLETAHFVDKHRESLPTLTRAQEDALMVGVPLRSPDICQMGSSCESLIMSKAKGVNPPICLPCVEIEGFGPYLQCILCMRGTATRGLLKIRMDDVSMIQDACLQTHVNLVNLNREYRKEHTLPIRRDKYEGVVAPCVAHFFSGYTAKERAGASETSVRYWEQSGYTMPDVVPYDVQNSDAACSSGADQEGSFLLNAPRTTAMH